LKNKIEATDININSLLKNQKNLPRDFGPKKTIFCTSTKI
jgi:hypothetical protein